ncbi:MAG: helix-turn-helix transcriptional regulator [Bacteroidales bacterium]|jgi:transcriptional regulator with XRE-family HTH domain
MISNNINKYRKAKKITLEELSKKIKMSYTGLRLALENDDFKISTLTKIANVLGVDLNDLLKEDTNISIKNKGNFGVGDNIKQSIGKDAKINNENMFIKEIEHLKELLKNKDEIIKGKDEIIEQLKRQIK